MKMYDDQLIVMTGGAGFIGSCLIRHLNDLGMTNIVVVDELGQTEKWKNLVGKHIFDVIDKANFFEWLSGRESIIEAFIHLGACSDTQETNASYLLDKNYRFSVRLAEYALRNKQRFIYASSAATYGDGSLGFVDDPKMLDKLQPLNMYGFSKHLFDLWVKNQGLLDHVVGLKYFNVFGPNEAHKGSMASAITRMVPALQRGQEIQLFKSTDPTRFGDGEQVRDFIYVKDVVRMTCAFLENDEMGLFNIGSGVASTWNDLANATYKAMGKKPAIKYVDMPSAMVPHYQNYTCADMARTRKVLKKKASTMLLEDAVGDYIRHYLIPGKRW
jgi:ADP-L-glycero-D-manno-heptose 6-epimerase